MATTASPISVPDGLPLLTRGRHVDPAAGSCLMEYVSVLAGERFSDRPRCTHPLLAWAARRVNDTVGDTVRPELAVLAPDLIGTRIHRRRARTVVRAAIYVELATAGLVAEPGHRVLRELRELALAHLAGRRRLRPMGTVDRNGVFETTLAALGSVEAARRDELLGAALIAAVGRARRLLDLDDRAVHETPSPGDQRVAAPA